MRSLPKLFIVLALAAPGSLSARWVDEKGRRLPDTEGMKAHGDFGVQIVLTPSEAKFREAWSKSATPPSLQSTQSVRRGDEISAMILFHGCAADGTGTCKGLVRFTLVSPDGSSTAAGEGPLWTGRSERGRILLSNASLTLRFDNTDKVGRYKVIATVVDEKAGKSIQVSVPFSAL